MAFLNEFSSDKSKMLQLFLSDREFVDIVTSSTNRPIPDLSLRYSQVFPYSWIPGTATETKTFVCFDVDVPRVITSAIKDVQLSVWGFTHESLMRTSTGTRTDILASRIDELLNGSSGFGAGQVELKSVGRINPATNFYGRQLIYLVKDFNRLVCAS